MAVLSTYHADRIPKSSGTYVLILRLSARRVIQVGKLGANDFPTGYYLYVGSAFGPGGLAARLGRHLKPDQETKPVHWHIDYLRRWAPIVAIWFGEQQVRREHDWATLIGQLPGSDCPAPRFGASDCRCRSHLFHFAQLPAVERFSASLSRALPGDEPLQIIKIGQEYETL
jgi:Uri superfamily endonuclease